MADTIPPRRIFVVIEKSEGHEHDRPAKFGWIWKVLTAVVIPVSIAAGGWWVKQGLQGQTVRRDYVQLSVELLRDSSGATPGLSDWAADVLSENSPTKLPKSLRDDLARRHTTLPGPSYVSPVVQPVESLDPTVRALASQLVKDSRTAGVPFQISKTFVSSEMQDSLYARGLDQHRGGESTHNFGLAFDVIPNNGLGRGPTSPDSALYRKIRELGCRLGLSSGTDRYKVYIHFEWKDGLDKNCPPR
jgi:hypothetical protein